MDQRKVLRYSRYLITRIFASIFLYQICMNRYVYSILYRTLKDSLYQVTTEKNEDNCILKNPLVQDLSSNINCLNCETLREVKKIYYTSYSEIHWLYLKQNIPVIVIDAMFDWSVLINPLTIQNFTQVYYKPRYQDIIPCELSSSLNLYSMKYLSDIFDTTLQLPLRSWFISWKNCDLTSAKAIRNFYQQPYFVKYYVPTAKVNSVIIYSDYASHPNYRKFAVKDRKLLLFMQIRGSLNLKLVPKKCSIRCYTIVIKLEESQILVLNSEFWQLEYSSSSRDTNIAILTENNLE